MKWIKKVIATQLEETTGKIINSLTASVDKTTNAPSIQAVVDGLAGKADTLNITTLTKSVTPSGSGDVSARFDLPDGFTKDNLIILQVKAKINHAGISIYDTTTPTNLNVTVETTASTLIDHIDVSFNEEDTYRVELTIMRI